MKAYSFHDVESGPDELIIIGFGDLQADPRLRGKPRAADFRRAEKVLRWGMANGAYFIGMGDYVDAMSPSNRDRWNVANLYDSPRDAMDEASYAVLDEVYELMSIAEGRWLGLLSGHHYHVFQDEGHSDILLADRLNTEHFGGGEVEVSMYMPSKGRGRARPLVKVSAMHGRSSNARTRAAVLNELDRIASNREGIDVFLLGHFHQVASMKVQKFRWLGGERGGTPTLTHRDVALVATGSYMRGYAQDQRLAARPLYPELGAMPPNALGTVAASVNVVYDKNRRPTLETNFRSL